jgi:hypothetical protein
MNRDLFQSYAPAENHTVSGFGSVRCHGTGIVAITSHTKNSAYNITLNGALHVPDAPYNLLSIGRMANVGFSIQFNKELMQVFSPGPHRKEIIRGSKIGNLYLVKITAAATRGASPSTPSSPAKPTLIFATAPFHSWDKWHRIFGHISPASVKLLKNHDMVDGMNVDPSSTPSAQCEACIKGKSHVAPLPAEAERTYTE